MGKQYLDSCAGNSPKVLRHHRNWALRGGETRGVPRGTGKTSTGFSKGADLGIIRTPFLRLAHKSSGSAHSHTCIGRYRKGSVPRFPLRGKLLSEPQQLS